MFCLGKKSLKLLNKINTVFFYQTPLTWVLPLGKCSFGISSDEGVDKTGNSKGPRNVSEHYSQFCMRHKPLMSSFLIMWPIQEFWKVLLTSWRTQWPRQVQKEKFCNRTFKILGLSQDIPGMSWEVHSQLLYPVGHTDTYQISVFLNQKTASFPFWTTESCSFLPLSCSFFPPPQAKRQEQMKCWQNVHCRGQFPLMDDTSITGGSSFSLLSLKYISNY